MNKSVISRDDSGPSYRVAEINQAGCVSCNACIVLCPASAAQFVKTADGHQVAYIFRDLCTGCGLCMDLCCWGAVNVYGVDGNGGKKHD